VESEVKEGEGSGLQGGGKIWKRKKLLIDYKNNSEEIDGRPSPKERRHIIQEGGGGGGET